MAPWGHKMEPLFIWGTGSHAMSSSSRIRSLVLWGDYVGLA